MMMLLVFLFFAAPLWAHQSLTSVVPGSYPYTAATGQRVLCDATAGARSINLPAATGSNGVVEIYKTDASANACNPVPNGSDAIAAGGATTITQRGGGIKLVDTASGKWTDTGVPPAATGGSGTVTSVGVSVPSRESVSGSPVTSSGTVAITDNAQSANNFLAGPATGSAAAPTFRKLTSNADTPNAEVILYRVAAPGTVISNTTNETNLWQVSLPGGTLGSDGVIEIEAFVQYFNQSGSTDTGVTISLYYGANLGGTQIVQGTVNGQGTGSGGLWHAIHVRAIIAAANATNAQSALARFAFGQYSGQTGTENDSGELTTARLSSTTGITADSTASQNLQLTETMTLANTNTKIQLIFLTAKLIQP